MVGERMGKIEEILLCLVNETGNCLEGMDRKGVREISEDKKSGYDDDMNNECKQIKLR